MLCRRTWFSGSWGDASCWQCREIGVPFGRGALLALASKEKNNVKRNNPSWGRFPLGEKHK